jgi:hypothetical protein
MRRLPGKFTLIPMRMATQSVACLSPQNFTDDSAGCSPNPVSYDETARTIRRNERSLAVTSGANEIYDEYPNVNSISGGEPDDHRRSIRRGREREKKRKICDVMRSTKRFLRDVGFCSFALLLTGAISYGNDVWHESAALESLDACGGCIIAFGQSQLSAKEESRAANGEDRLDRTCVVW